MIKIENTETYGWQAAIRGLRNPLNSWERSDTKYYDSDTVDGWELGDRDKDLMLRMNASTEQSKYRRMITVTFDVVAPLYWFKEMDTYRVGVVCNSCSTMHTIHKKPFELDDFSHEHIGEGMSTEVFNECLENIINILNEARLCYLDDGNKMWWWQMIQLLPSSYNQRRTYQMNYEVLASIYRQRKNHKLTEWVDFCKWIETLPYSELITGKGI